MAASTTLTTLVDGTKTQVIHVTILSDGAELSDSVIYDYSEDSLLPAGSAAATSKIKSIEFSNPTASGQIFVEFDGSTDRLISGCGVADSHKEDYRWCGGIKNHAGSPTGDVTVTTLGFASGDQATLVLELSKS
tara:strand:- start:956 stop:1357 length:402 start_codon:yes stop_codon:yes gene_type:complete